MPDNNWVYLDIVAGYQTLLCEKGIGWQMISVRVIDRGMRIEIEIKVDLGNFFVDLDGFSLYNQHNVEK